ncbi:berberine bridge enzyme-like 4 [Gastrolobium bilobum]|uniref:berberine bridge enzyme-like 4 n=1 Tax=Gastrolobium bilobum TaxID=150636 RepID=UPI002AB2EA0F|nr:berberine bridge enzyme-like 4 [Gastrolobium bilobum]
MDIMKPFFLFLSILTFVQSVHKAASNSSPLENFLQCLSNHSLPSNPTSNAIYTPNNSSFLSILHMHTYNHRFSAPSAPKPLAIVTALHESHVQGTVTCAKYNGLQIRIRSGGHDTEGLSYVSDVPFIILDMFNLNSVDVDIANGTTWVQAGATLGKVYYNIAEKSKVHGFPAGVCSTLGSGGHFSGGGYGNLMRKYGLSVDNIIDAQLVDVNGKILDRKSMGEDLFWAIRGGGGASFGVILSWKIKLVQVTPMVTVFKVKKTVEEGATDVVYKWQLIATELPEDLYIRAMPEVVNGTQSGKKTVQVTFIGLFLGQSDKLLPLLNESFPELGLLQSDCIEMPWVNSTLYWYSFPIGTPIEALLDVPKEPTSNNFKTMSDYVKKLIPKTALASIWDFMIRSESVRMEWNPYGGKMHEISPSETPFPHRAGNLFLIEYLTSWGEDGVEAKSHYLNISSAFYQFMTPYVSNSPREAFLNYRDLNIGANLPSNATSMDIARIYGSKYFRGNFERLMSVKFKVDPENFFRNEQSIPCKKICCVILNDKCKSHI